MSPACTGQGSREFGAGRGSRQDVSMENTDQQPWVKNYQPGVPAEIELPTESLVAMLERSVAEAGTAPALEFFGRRTSYSELGEQVDRAAEGLRRLGVRTGDRVALILPNCPQHVVAFYAVLRLGAIVAEHNQLAAPAEVQAQLERHGARVVVAWEKALPLVAAQGNLAERTIFAVDLTAALPLHSRLLLRMPVRAARTQREAM